MFKSKAIQILRTLTNKEFKRLEDFVASPLWKHPAQAVNLFNILRKLYPDFDEKKLARVRVFRQIFPREVFNEQKLRYVISDLTKLLEQFIAQLNYMSDATHLNHHLQRAYAERGLSKFFYQSIEAGKEAIEKNELRDVQYNFNKFILEEERYIYSSVNNRQVVENENIIQDLENLIRNLDLFYVAKKLRYSCEFANNQNVFVLNYPNPLFLDAILQYLAQIEPAQLPPAVLVYRQVWHMLTKQNAEADYHELLNILNLYDTQFQKTELYEIYTYACNYCIRQINKGQYHFMQHLFNIYKLLIDKEILISVGSLSERMYKNIVSLALKLGHFDFAQTFMHDYKKWLPPDNQTNAFTFNKANWYFHQNQFDKTVQTLNQVEFTDAFYHLDTKILLLKCYYEMGEEIPLYNLIETMRAYLLRNKTAAKASKYHYVIFLKQVKRLMNYKMGEGKSIHQFKEKVLKGLQLAGHTNWLLSKITELAKKYPQAD